MIFGLIASSLIILAILACVQARSYSVFPIAGWEDLYMQLQRSNPLPSDMQSEGPEAMAEICAAIISSPFISDTYDVCAIKPNLSSNAEKNLRSNDYVRYEITMGDNKVQEHLFPCPSLHRQTGDVVHLLISREYRPVYTCLSVTDESSNRFVFKENELKEPKAVARVERSCSCWKYVFTWYRPTEPDDPGWYELNKLATNPTICNMSAASRIRLCTHVIDSTRSELKFRFQDNQNPPSKCETRELRYPMEWVGKTGAEYNYYKDPFNAWTIECEATKLNGEDSTSIYLSLNVEEDEFLVSQRREVSHACRVPGSIPRSPSPLSSFIDDEVPTY